MKDNKEKQQLRFNDFILNKVPLIEKKYKVIIFEHHVKIINDLGKSFDYYPKGQVVMKRIGDSRAHKSTHIEIDELLKKLKI